MKNLDSWASSQLYGSEAPGQRSENSAPVRFSCDPYTVSTALRGRQQCFGLSRFWRGVNADACVGVRRQCEGGVGQEQVFSSGVQLSTSSNRPQGNDLSRVLQTWSDLLDDTEGMSWALRAFIPNQCEEWSPVSRCGSPT